ncbi:MAG: hypothetical protein JWQ09_5727 [Segetibacter sp.]|nr:hypothetical protein [Segetibacter sp.]
MPVEEHVYLCTVTKSLSSEDRRFLITEFLSEAEHNKSLLFKDEKKRDEYIQSHAFKRFILSPILEVPPSAITFYTNDFGKPFISEEINKKQIYFNLSHTSGLTALITSDNNCIGIDVENMIRRDDIPLLEHIVFHEEELIESKRITDETELMNNFYTKWVIKESILKAVGTGLSIEPKLLLIKKDPKGTFTLESEMIENASSFKIIYNPFMNWAVAYSSCSSNNNIHDEVNTTLYNYSNCLFNLIT